LLYTYTYTYTSRLHIRQNLINTYSCTQTNIFLGNIQRSEYADVVTISVSRRPVLQLEVREDRDKSD